MVSVDVYNMAATSGLPVWLLDSKEEITKSYQWPSFLQDLYDSIQQQLKESHVESFSNLTEAERTLFMERATQAISGGQSYSDLYKKVSNALDRQLNNEVGRQLMEDQPVETKTDLILDTAQDGIIGLLKKWPDMKSKLHVCLNQPQSESMRPVVWRLFLKNPKVKKTYIQTLSNNPRSAVSPLDFEITQKCQDLLRSESTLEDVRNSTGAFFAMKAVLSYYHSQTGSRHPLSDSHYNLIIPFIIVAAPKLPRKEPAPGQLVAIITEEYFAFMASLPNFVTESIHKLSDDQVRIFAGRVAHHLRQIGPDAAKAINDAFVPYNDETTSTELGNKVLLTDAVTALFKPIIRNMFVGHVNKDVLLYIWDQYIIGLDTPGFSDDYLPAVTAVYLKLLGEKLKGCTSLESLIGDNEDVSRYFSVFQPARMELCLKSEGVKLTVPQFQYEIHKHFFLELSSRLKQDDRSAMPVVDPTQATFSPWQNWFADQRIPGHTTAQQRRAARDEREAERQKILEKKSENLRKERREEEERFLEQQADYQRRNDEDRQYMEERLAEERRRANEQIELLTRQVLELQRNQMRPVTAREEIVNVRPASGNSLRSVSRYLLPSQPTEFDVETPRLPPILKMPKPNTPPDQQANNVVGDFLSKINYSFNKVAHGEGHQRQYLDDKTRDSISVHGADVKAAEKEVMGRELRPGEFEDMPLAEREQKSDEIMDVVRRRIMERHRNDFL